MQRNEVRLVSILCSNSEPNDLKPETLKLLDENIGSTL